MHSSLQRCYQYMLGTEPSARHSHAINDCKLAARAASHTDTALAAECSTQAPVRPAQPYLMLSALCIDRPLASGRDKTALRDNKQLTGNIARHQRSGLRNRVHDLQVSTALHMHGQW